MENLSGLRHIVWIYAMSHFLLRRAGLLMPQRQQRSHSSQTLGSGHPGRTKICSVCSLVGYKRNLNPLYAVILLLLS